MLRRRFPQLEDEQEALEFSATTPERRPNIEARRN
jgi:hypothetical protein